MNFDAISCWLTDILYERFGHRFIICKDAENYWQLTLPGDDAVINIESTFSSFSKSDSDIICREWNACDEGWEPAYRALLPMPGIAKASVPLIKKVNNGYIVHYDILGLTYWMFSRYEEVGRTDLDEHGRFPATSSHAFKHGYLDRPVVDEWLHILGQVIQRVWPQLELTQHQFSTKVSHDVDRPSRYGFSNAKGLVRAMTRDALKHRELKNALLAPWVNLHSKQALHRADPANNFDWIMDVSELHGLKSAFYFICGCTNPVKDADYEPEHPAIRELMRRIHKRGHEIGLHPSYSTYQQPAAIALEAARLKRVCAEEGIQQHAWGGRMHYLRWETPTTLYGWEQAGMTYDTTLSYADAPGFRCGTCFEYPAFDPVAGKQLKLRIRPLIAMECTVMASCYLGLGTGTAALAKFTQLKNACRAVGGTFSLLWHNSEFSTPKLRHLYQDVLAA